MLLRSALLVAALACSCRPTLGLYNFETVYAFEDDQKKIKGMEPAGTSFGLPVFVFLGGTGDKFGAKSTAHFVEAMARRGFISAEIDYPNSWRDYEWNLVQEQWGDGGLKKFLNSARKKAAKIFPSALDELCSRPRADCSNGVAVSGFSQGGYITLFSVQYDPRISAIMPLGVECLHKKKNLPVDDFGDAFLSQYVGTSNRLIINGGGEDRHPECLAKISGRMECGTGTDCRRADGSGFMFVANAGHNFYANCNPSDKDTEMKCDYLEGTEVWALPAATDWLAQRAAPTKAVVPADGVQSCSRSSGSDTDINDSRSCVNWSVLPGFWAGFAILMLLCCVLPGCLAIFWARKLCCFAPKNPDLGLPPAQYYQQQSEQPVYFPPPPMPVESEQRQQPVYLSPAAMSMEPRTMEPHYLEPDVEFSEEPLSPEQFHARYGPSPYVQVPETSHPPRRFQPPPAYPPPAQEFYPPPAHEFYPPPVQEFYPPPAQEFYPPPAQEFYPPPAHEFYPPPLAMSQPPMAPPAFQMPIYQAVPEPTQFYTGPPAMEFQAPGNSSYAPFQPREYSPSPPPPARTQQLFAT